MSEKANIYKYLACCPLQIQLEFLKNTKLCKMLSSEPCRITMTLI